MVLDCTIRDGGLVNNHQFEDNFVKAVYECCIATGTDVMEIGYKNSDKIVSPNGMGAWRYCHEDDVRRIVGENPSSLLLACMVDAGKSDWKNDILPKEKSPIDVIRVAFYSYQLEEAVAMIQDAHDKGYEVSANLMAVTAVAEPELDHVLDTLIKTPTTTVVVVDSFGSLAPEQSAYLTEKYLKFCEPAGKEVGMHAHNNQQLAFANTIEAIRRGATRVDATLAGLGRGAGNCPMELLIGYLKNPKFNHRAVFECLENHVQPLRKQIEWGPYPEFMITGLFNQHPRSAIAAREGEKRDHYASFYDELAATAK
ncbi:MAG: aldolase catalytic domain-containing protein [Planctomycetia bacterium]|nr:aldolase catalytic domain-containing protein [Planctomycetia bacterium]